MSNPIFTPKLLCISVSARENILSPKASKAELFAALQLALKALDKETGSIAESSKVLFDALQDFRKE